MSAVSLRPLRDKVGKLSLAKKWRGDGVKNKKNGKKRYIYKRMVRKFWFKRNGMRIGK